MKLPGPILVGLLLPLGVAADSLFLDPPQAALPVHTRMDLALCLDTGARSAGAVQFDLVTDPDSAVEVEAVLPERRATGGGFAPTVTRSGGIVRVVAVNALRPDAPSTPGRILTVRIRAGATNGVGVLSITNAKVFGTAAYADVQEVGGAPIPVSVTGATCTVAATRTIPAPAIVGLPATLERGRTYPARLEVDTGPLALAAFELAMDYSTAGLRVVKVDPSVRFLALFAEPTGLRSGQGRLFGCLAGGADVPRGRFDVATIWVEALADSPAEISVSFRSLYGSAGLDSRALAAPTGTRAIASVPAPVGGGALAAPDPASVYTNALLSMPVAAHFGGSRTPQVVLGRVDFDPAMLVPVGVRPTVVSDWARSVVITNAAFPGTQWFWLTDLEAGCGEETPADAVVLDWTVLGPVLARGTVALNLSAMATGTGFGVGAAATAVDQEQYLIVRGAPGDGDGDGMDDWWEQYYEVDDAEADPDGDRMSNGEEYLVLTDPTDGASSFTMSASEAVSEEEPVLTIAWPSLPKAAYRLLSAPSLTEGPMETLVDSIPASPPFNRFVITNRAGPSRFFRVEAVGE